MTVGALFTLNAIAGCDHSSSSSAGSASSSTPLAASAPIASVAADSLPVDIATVTLPDVFMADEGATMLHVKWEIPQGTGINDDAPFRVRWTTSEGLSEVPQDEKSKGADVKTGFDVEVAPLKGEPAAHLAGSLEVVVCDAETHKVCVPVKRKIEVTFSVQKGGKRNVAVSVPLPAARPGAH